MAAATEALIGVGEDSGVVDSAVVGDSREGDSLEAAGSPEEGALVEAGKNPHPSAWSRPLRRLWRPFLNVVEKKRIAAAINEAESHTTGTIHVEIISSSGGRDMLELAQIKFRVLELKKTRDRNAVLILISHLDHRFAIWGDEGIHSQAGHPLWEKAQRTLLEHFRARRYPEGIIACVQELGRELARHYPRNSGV